MAAAAAAEAPLGTSAPALPEISYPAAQAAVRSLVASLTDAENVARCAELERLKEELGGDVPAYMASCVPLALAMARRVLETTEFAADACGLMQFVGAVQRHEAAARKAADAGDAEARQFCEDIARIRGLLMPPTMSVPDDMAAKKAAMDRRMAARREARDRSKLKQDKSAAG